MKRNAVAIAALLMTQISCATGAPVGMPCADTTIHSLRSIELQQILKADQSDRSCLIDGSQCDPKTLDKMSKNDLKRRMRVGEIFGEGCLKSASDYEAAFIVYQHGNTSGQYFQAYLWAKESLDLGNNQMKDRIAEAIDRYLVSIGKKELFGTQATQVVKGGCWCIQPIEDSFPENLRNEYRGGPDADYTGLAFLKTLNKGTDCSANYCNTNLLPSPQGTVPGFW